MKKKKKEMSVDFLEMSLERPKSTQTQRLHQIECNLDHEQAHCANCLGNATN